MSESKMVPCVFPSVSYTIPNNCPVFVTFSLFQLPMPTTVLLWSGFQLRAHIVLEVVCTVAPVCAIQRVGSVRVTSRSWIFKPNSCDFSFSTLIAAFSQPFPSSFLAIVLLLTFGPRIFADMSTNPTITTLRKIIAWA
jgi:hypothetical protein